MKKYSGQNLNHNVPLEDFFFAIYFVFQRKCFEGKKNKHSTVQDNIKSTKDKSQS